jgi:tRNA-splicing ligase RtcB
MGTASYIVRGLGNRESFESCSHGAGRVLGRKEAKRTLNESIVEKMMKGIWTNQIPLDESPQAYKNIDEVIDSQSDLIEPVVKLFPIGVIVGS